MSDQNQYIEELKAFCAELLKGGRHEQLTAGDVVNEITERFITPREKCSPGNLDNVPASDLVANLRKRGYTVYAVKNRIEEEL